MLDKDQLIRQVAEKHKVILGEDDPVFGMLALNDLIMQHYSSHFEAAVARLEQVVLTTATANAALVRQQSEATLGQALYGFKKILEDGTGQLYVESKAISPEVSQAKTGEKTLQVDSKVTTVALAIMGCLTLALTAITYLRW